MPRFRAARSTDRSSSRCSPGYGSPGRIGCRAQGLLIDPIVPGLSVAITYLSCIVWLYRDEQRQRRFVREAFGRYVSPAVVARLAEDPTKLNLGGEQRTLTIMFCDIRGT